MAISITEVFELIQTHITPLSSEVLPIEESLGRIVAREYRAGYSLPRFDNSAMDGYAVKLTNKGESLPSDKVIYAGDEDRYTLHEGEAIRIMTGAPIPQGCEAIVPIEDVKVEGGSVTLPHYIKPNAHIRRSGEDIKVGESIIEKSQRVSGYTLALFASQGITHIEVNRIPKVAVLATGDELKSHHEKILPHQLYNSNTPMFAARAKELGCEVRVVTSGGDDYATLKEKIEGLLDVDLIVTSGGISVGDKDFTKQSFEDMGMEILCSGIDIKPGKPTTIGKINSTVIVNLPGNPLAAMVNFEMFVKLIILKLSGTSHNHHGIIETRMEHEYNHKSGKYTVVLGRYDGIHFIPLPTQAPGMVSPLIHADGMIVTTPEVTTIAAEESVKMIPIKMRFDSKTKRDIFTKY